MWKKSKLVLLSSAFAFSLTCGSTKFVALAASDIESSVKENITQNYLKVKFENKVLFHEKVPSKTLIQVLNTNAEVLKSEVLSGDTEMELDALETQKGKMLSYWAIEKIKDKITIEPILIDANELSVKFFSAEGGELLENNAQTKEIVKSVNKGENLKAILPEVNPNNHYKFVGWFEKEQKLKNIDDIKILDSTGEYYAKFYPDFNENDVDDRTEEITVKFVTNSQEKINDVKTYVSNQIKLPTLEKNGFVFMGWYTDQEYKNKFKNDILNESLTLYAKWGNAEKVIKDSETKPVTDKDISDQIEKILNERLKGLSTNNSGSTKNNSIATQTPSKLSSNDSKTNKSNDSVVNKNQSNSQGIAVQENVFKETKYIYENKNIGKKYMVKFFDENETFLFSLTIPYGKTIKTFDENDQFHDEYAVRQDTTISLNTKEYIREKSILVGFETRDVKVNSAQITEIYPHTKSNLNAANVAYEQQKAMEEQEQANQKKKNIIITLVGLAVVIICGVGIYLFKKRKKHAQLESI